MNKYICTKTHESRKQKIKKLLLCINGALISYINFVLKCAIDFMVF